jgi:Effector Associated Constant Component 1
VQVELRVRGGNTVTELTELWQWMHSERALAGAVSLVRGPAVEGELSGGLYECLVVALGSGGAVAAMASTLTAWLKTRKPDVRVTATSESGTVTVEVRHAKSDQVMPLLDRVLPSRTTPGADD